MVALSSIQPTCEITLWANGYGRPEPSRLQNSIPGDYHLSKKGKWIMWPLPCPHLPCHFTRIRSIFFLKCLSYLRWYQIFTSVSFWFSQLFSPLPSTESGTVLYSLAVHRALAFYTSRTKYFHKSSKLFMRYHGAKMEELITLFQRLSKWLVTTVGCPTSFWFPERSFIPPGLLQPPQPFSEGYR